MGITALISTLLGFLGGVLPDLMRELRDSRNHGRELDFIRTQHELQIERMKLEAGSKLREAEAGLAAEEVRAMREHLTAIIESQAKPTGIAWIDGLNAVIRPLAAIFILMLFMITAGAYVHAVIGQYQAGQIASVADLVTAIWGSMIGFSIEAALGFLFGARQARKGASP
jgi:hypothetical protein